MPKRKPILILGYAGIGVLSLLILVMLFPIVKQETFALCTPESSAEECMAKPISTEVGVMAKTVIALALDNQVQMEVIPKSNGATSYASTRLAVSTNSNDGYAIYLQTGSETGSLTGVTNNLSKEISNTVKNKVVLDSLENNSYGFALSKTEVNSNTLYSHIPTTNTVVESTDASASLSGEYPYGDTYYLAFGTKVGTDLPAGQYAGSVTVSAVANPTTLRSMYDLIYMQDMTSDICSNTKEHYTKQLIDTRDGKSYWVAKLKDGNCWMTQNLALDLEEGTTLTSADTDLANTATKSWTVPKSTISEIPLPNTGNNSDAQSWNLGKLVLTKPTNSSMCPKQDPAVSGIVGQKYPNSDADNNAFTGQNIADTCSNQVVDVSNGWTDGYIATETNSIDETVKTYDAHYLFGNYYSWNAAVAGTGFTTDGANITGTSATNAEGAGLTNAPGSICPKGWQLPKAGRNTSGTETVFGVGPGQSYDIDGSFFHLLKAYGYDSGWIGKYALVPISHADRTANLSDIPMYFVRSGVVSPYIGALRRVGGYGYDWSSTVWPEKNTSSCMLVFDASYVYPSNEFDRINGFPVRCLAR